MSETKFTPGPWQVRFCESGGYDCMSDCFAVETNKGQLVTAVDCGDYGQFPCDVLSDVVREKASANAHLISAATELYQALEALLSEIDLLGVDGFRLQDKKEAADAALKKARGES